MIGIQNEMSNISLKIQQLQSYLEHVRDKSDAVSNNVADLRMQGCSDSPLPGSELDRVVFRCPTSHRALMISMMILSACKASALTREGVIC